jgi:hypothetical protein
MNQIGPKHQLGCQHTEDHFNICGPVEIFTEHKDICSVKDYVYRVLWFQRNSLVSEIK